jgi:predicted double-glycine peptidase
MTAMPTPLVPVMPAVVPVAPAPAAAYQGMLDQLHLLSQSPTAPVTPAPVTPPPVTPPPVAPAPISPAAPTPPTLSGLFQRLDKLVDQWLAPKPAPVPPQTPPPQQTKPKPADPKEKPAPKPQPKPEPKPEPKPQPKPQPKPAPKLPTMNRENFISQYRSASNSNEDASRNGNCGPTSLTMIAEAFGKIKVTPGSANKAIEETRRRMGAGTTQSSEYDGTSYAQLQQGAKSYGLTSKVVYGSIAEIQKELKAGKLVIAHVRPDYLFPGTTSGHYAVVTKIDGDKVHMHDPANSKGPMVVSVATFKKAQAGRGTWGLVSVGR